MKLTQQDMARILGITTVTLRNWRRDKPELYRIIMQGFAVDKAREMLLETVQEFDLLATTREPQKRPH